MTVHTNIVFLDIDGVVRPYGGSMDFDPKCLQLLNRIIATAKAQIVLSSSWRTTTSGVRLVNLALKRLQCLIVAYDIYANFN